MLPKPDAVHISYSIHEIIEELSEGVCSNSRHPYHPARVMGSVRPAVADTVSSESAESGDEFQIVQKNICFHCQSEP